MVKVEEVAAGVVVIAGVAVQDVVVRDAEEAVGVEAGVVVETLLPIPSHRSDSSCSGIGAVTPLLLAFIFSRRLAKKIKMD